MFSVNGALDSAVSDGLALALNLVSEFWYVLAAVVAVLVVAWVLTILKGGA